MKLPVTAALFLALPVLAFAQTPPTTRPDDRNYRVHPAFQTQWEDYSAAMRGKSVDLIFIGDSITEQWRWGAGRPVWKEHFAANALNFGQGSDTTQNTLWRLQNLEVKAIHPKVAVILIGTNNFKDTADDIAAGVKAVAEATRETFPGIQVVLVSILPNARATDLMAEANAKIQAMVDGKSLFYLDLASRFTPEGENWKGLGRDKLHLTPEGYEMWAAALQPLLAQLLPAGRQAPAEVRETRTGTDSGKP